MAYYEQQCSKEKKEAYSAILRGVQTADSAIRVPLLPIQELGEVFTRLRLDHPEIFYLVSFQVRFLPGAEKGDFVPEYLFPKEKILAHRQAINTRVERLTREVRNRSEGEKITFLHQFIIENVRYDKLKKAYSHEIIGPLTQGVGVCEGIAKTVKLLADALRLECLVALSAPEEGKRYGHAWNVIKRGGKWYHMDATFDLSLSACGESRWDYCLLPDDRIYRDHVKPIFSIPECTEYSGFYYREQKLSFTKPEDLARRITQAARKKKSRFIFHWRGGYLTRIAAEELLTLICTAAAEGGKHAQVSLNWPQSVFCVQFSEIPPASGTLVLELADEENAASGAPDSLQLP